MEDVRQIVRTFILESFLPGDPSESLDNDTDLKDAGILDSLSMLKLLTFLEERFRVEFTPEELGEGSLSSVVKIEQLLRVKTGART